MTLDLPAALAWLGRQGTRAVALSIFVSLALPALATLFKPFVAELIFLLLCLAFLRVRPAELHGYFRKPGLLAAATFWTIIAVPALFGSLLLAIGLPEKSPALHLTLMLQIAGPPLTSAPAFAALLGLDAALALALLICAMMVTPITAPIFTALFIGASMQVSPIELGIKLFLLVGGAALVAAAVRWFSGTERIARLSQQIDGINVIVMFFFAVALMEGVGMRIITEPIFVLGLLALAFGLSAGVGLITLAVFAWLGRLRAFTLGLGTGQRNMGLMLAATAGAAPDLTWLYFAIAQFPIYLSPQLLKPIVTRFIFDPTQRVAPPRPPC